MALNYEYTNAYELMITVDGKRCPYTLKEIVELDYPDFWGGAKECIRIAKELQNMVLKLLPDYRRLLPRSFEQLKEHKSVQTTMLNYIKLRSTFGLAYAVWETIDKNCRKLAQARLDAEQDQIEDAMERLVEVMSLVDSITKSFDYISDEENGYDRLLDMIVANCPHLYFYVLRVAGKDTWEYQNVVGTIQSVGFGNEDLFNSVIADEVPKESNIGGLMEKPEDDKMVIVY